MPKIQEPPGRYRSAEQVSHDDFAQPFTMETGEAIYDAVTITGQWAMMTQNSYNRYARNPLRLGTGIGQKYVRQENGELHKTEG